MFFWWPSENSLYLSVGVMDTSDDNNEGRVVAFRPNDGLGGDTGLLFGWAFDWLEATRVADWLK
jgi:hypothetical protein